MWQERLDFTSSYFLQHNILLYIKYRLDTVGLRYLVQVVVYVTWTVIIPPSQLSVVKNVQLNLDDTNSLKRQTLSTHLKKVHNTQCSKYLYKKCLYKHTQYECFFYLCKAACVEQKMTSR